MGVSGSGVGGGNIWLPDVLLAQMFAMHAQIKYSLAYLQDLILTLIGIIIECNYSGHVMTFNLRMICSDSFVQFEQNTEL